MARRAAVACEVLRFRQIGVGDRVGELRRLRRVVRPDVDVDDEGAVGLLDVDVAVQGVQRRRLPSCDFLGRPRLDPDQAEQRRIDAPMRAPPPNSGSLSISVLWITCSSTLFEVIRRAWLSTTIARPETSWVRGVSSRSTSCSSRGST